MKRFSAKVSARSLHALDRFFPAALAAVFFLSFFAAPAQALAQTITARVKKVVDGDTVVIEGGRKVRYIGIDTPERDEPFFTEARERNISLVLGKLVSLVVCEAEPRDRFGRLLAFVYADGLFVNRALVEEGLARRLIIPPCGLPVATEFKLLEQDAKETGRGLWARPVSGDIAPRP